MALCCFIYKILSLEPNLRPIDLSYCFGNTSFVVVKHRHESTFHGWLSLKPTTNGASPLKCVCKKLPQKISRRILPRIPRRFSVRTSSPPNMQVTRSNNTKVLWPFNKQRKTQIADILSTNERSTMQCRYMYYDGNDAVFFAKKSQPFKSFCVFFSSCHVQTEFPWNVSVPVWLTN